ncbi:hypothetical protein [Leucothrix pacifica]|uniref:Uncharacterized protein n=1 Tax=Leucothrix pacifica TaxID=1247513 RepID=A0A317CPL2_9GAMM|nr:hypothetical protein [Leucothrix pacifica]PWR00499.1 hypothetical protein DKW60_01365 [Leucothrix pacifica]
MKLKSLLLTGIIAALVFICVVYFGIKYNWVNEAEPKFVSSQTIDSAPSSDTSTQSLDSRQNASQTGNGVKPELIDETPITIEGQSLGSSQLSIEEVVSQCHDIATSVGIPEQQFEQAVIECIDRNSTHLQTETVEIDERAMRIREQCDLAITQRDLLSPEEVKILVDECVASME